MTKQVRRFWLRFIISLFCSLSVASAMAQTSAPARLAHAPPIVIAHRGASGYVPEHTLASTAMAHAMNPDFIEQDVVLSRDGVPVVLHDIHLDSVTDVASRFPNRKRDDGRFYAIDFDLTEIKQLEVLERSRHDSQQPIFQGRFPRRPSGLKVMTLEESLTIIQGMNKSRNMNVGVYPEIKAPKWHHNEGYDLAEIVIRMLGKFGYRFADDNCFLQCFDQEELRRVRNKLNCQLRLIQLMGKDDWTRGNGESNSESLTEYLDRIKTYANGIGPPIEELVLLDKDGAFVGPSSLSTEAQARGLLIHPYTYRRDGLPHFAQSAEEIHQRLLDIQINGLFTDFPDQTRQLFEAASNR